MSNKGGWHGTGKRRSELNQAEIKQVLGEAEYNRRREVYGIEAAEQLSELEKECAIAGIITVDSHGRDAGMLVLSLYDPMGYNGSEEINDEPIEASIVSIDEYANERIGLESLIHLPSYGRYFVLDNVKAVSYHFVTVNTDKADLTADEITAVLSEMNNSPVSRW